VTDSQYLSIGEVLGLLLEDFPDVTISKIRFLESQGLIEPERTPSGYRKFYGHDVELLRTILHEQKANFLPLKVIRDRIESGALESETGPTRTPPRGIRNVEPPPEARDSVFRRTDGGPEWADGRALIPGDDTGPPAQPPITTAVQVTHAAPVVPRPPAPTVAEETPPAPVVDPPDAAPPAETPTEVAPPAKAKSTAAAPTSTEPKAVSGGRGLPYDRVELCAAAGVTLEQLAELEEFGIVAGRGSGNDVTYHADAVEIARIAAQFMERGIDARHLRAWRQSAERESDLFEQRIMPLLRQRNPQSRQLALDTLTEMAELGGQFRNALVTSMLRHHFDGG